MLLLKTNVQQDVLCQRSPGKHGLGSIFLSFIDMHDNFVSLFVVESFDAWPSWMACPVITVGAIITCSALDLWVIIKRQYCSLQ